MLARIRRNQYFDDVDFQDAENAEDFTAVCFWPNKCTIVQSQETDDEPQIDFKPGHLTQAALFECLDHADFTAAEPTLADQLNGARLDVEFVETLRQMLRLMRLLEFS